MTHRKRFAIGETTTRRGAALLLAMLLTLLLIAGTAELVATTAVETVMQARRHRGLTHALAVDSALLVLADRLMDAPQAPSPLVLALDRIGLASTQFTIGDVAVRCTLRDDGAKFNPNLFPRRHEKAVLRRSLHAVATRGRLPQATVRLLPIRTQLSEELSSPYRWFDQILTDVRPETLFRWGDTEGASAVWSDRVTFWGDGRVDLRRAEESVLEAALTDIRPGLARAILAARPADHSVDRSVDYTGTAMIAVDAEIRSKVAARLTFDARRYAIEIETRIDADRRRWYVVAHIHESEIDVWHRSRLRW